MIMIDVIIQGTIASSGAVAGIFTPTPFPIYLEDNWESSLIIAAGVYNPSPEKVTLSHRSVDNGDTYAVIAETIGNTVSFVGQSSLQKVAHSPLPSIAGNGILARQQGVWVQWKTASGEWVEKSLSSIPGAAIGGGTFESLTHDYVANEFIIIKSSGNSVDILTTPDFLAFDNPAGGVLNPLTISSNNLMTTVHNIYFIGGQYVAYGTDRPTSSMYITATSSDLFNWTKQVASLPVSTHAEQAFFNSRVIISRFDQPGAIHTRAIEIWSSSDGLTWTQATLPSQEATVGVTDHEFLVTASAIELLTDTYVYRSTNGTTWTRSLLQNNLRDANNTVPENALLGRAKGSLMDSAAGPDHIAIANVYSIQLGGKTVKLSQVNAVATLGYPSTAPEGATVGWIQTNFNRNMIIGDGFVLNDFPAVSAIIGQSLYARNAATTRYFEITVENATGTSSRVGARGLGYNHVDSASTDAVWFFVDNNIVTVSNGINIVVTHTHTAGQILGFLFDFTAQTCVIEVDGAALATIPDLNILLPWIVETTANSGQFKLNVGQESFSHNGTGATAWETQ